MLHVQEFLIYTSLQDSAETVPSGYNSSDGVSVWRQAGKLKVRIVVVQSSSGSSSCCCCCCYYGLL